MTETHGLNATVVGRTDVTPDLFVLRVVPDSGVPGFEAGQYTTLGLWGQAPRPPHLPPEPEPPDPHKLIKRAYSIGSAPSERAFLEFFLALVPTGALTSRLTLLQPGDRVFCGHKVTGHFTLRVVPPEAHLVLVATGTGLAPFRSMLGVESTFLPGRRITLLHGVRYAEDLAYADELLALQAARGDAFRYLPYVSRAEPPSHGYRGHVTRFFLDFPFLCEAATHHVMLCGNPAMIEDLERSLGERGFRLHSKKSPGNLHYEKYW
jgi:ferredoxin--NADP+ reductase